MSSPTYDKWYVHLSTVGIIGRIPFAPGTFGSIPGLFLGCGLFWFFQNYTHIDNLSWLVTLKLIIAAGIIGFAYFVIKKTEDYWNLHDRKEIVIDEVCGQLLPTLFLGTQTWIIIISFLFFRLFDIWKPWPVGHIDRNWHGASGTLFDDVAAGIMALVATSLVAPLLP